MAVMFRVVMVRPTSGESSEGSSTPRSKLPPSMKGERMRFMDENWIKKTIASGVQGERLTEEMSLVLYMSESGWQ